MTTHVIDKDADVPKEMERMHEENSKKWGNKLRPKCKAALQPTFVRANG